MIIQVPKEDLVETLGVASRFISSKLNTLTTLQGVLIEGTGKEIHFYSNSLSSSFHTNRKIPHEKPFQIIVDPRKILEFLTLLPIGKVTITIQESKLLIESGKTKATFPILTAKDFPKPPKTSEKGQKIKKSFFEKELPIVLFAGSNDETRPALSAVNFLTQEEQFLLVATDGFRLSLLKTKKEIDIPPLLIPCSFLAEVGRLIKDEEEILFNYIQTEKMVVIQAGDNEFYSRLIDGEFPPFERVLPTDKKTTIQLDHGELLRGVKLVSIFARESSNIMIFSIQKNSLLIKPKVESGEESETTLDCRVEGEAQQIALNFKFVLDFLNNVQSKEVIIEVLRPDAPIVFKSPDKKDFLHVIMPIRIQQ